MLLNLQGNLYLIYDDSISVKIDNSMLGTPLD